MEDEWCGLEARWKPFFAFRLHSENSCVFHGRRKGARGWQAFFHGLLMSEETAKAGFAVSVFEQSPTLYDIQEAEDVLELHVDGGRGTWKPHVIGRLLQYSEKRNDL